MSRGFRQCVLISMLASLVKGYTLVDDNEDSVLHIGGIFPIGGKGGWQGGQHDLNYQLCKTVRSTDMNKDMHQDSVDRVI
ncbi:unnamed protein product [Timema podura]|uniref:Uncharacterized protein n=1 Tax=Timema podura TaxID=61482 RepID=A0ABN7P6U6_TIMPD|nr:unnamed protein product [Timema podura]